MSEQTGGPNGRSIERATSGGSRAWARVAQGALFIVAFVGVLVAFWLVFREPGPAAAAWRVLSAWAAWAAGVTFGVGLRAWWRE